MINYSTVPNQDTSNCIDKLGPGDMFVNKDDPAFPSYVGYIQVISVMACGSLFKVFIATVVDPTLGDHAEIHTFKTIGELHSWLHEYGAIPAPEGTTIVMTAGDPRDLYDA
jgi:hypothetical protein